MIVLTGALSTAGGVLHDQAEADEDMSIKQRLVLAGGSALTGASEMVDNDIVADAMEVAGEFECHLLKPHPSLLSVFLPLLKPHPLTPSLCVLFLPLLKRHPLTFSTYEYYVYYDVGSVVKDQAEADEDTSLKNRALLAVGK